MKCQLFTILLPILISAFSIDVPLFAQPDKPNGQRPNIVFIFTDDQQFNALGANGNKILTTPTMDWIAKRGVRFTQARAVLPVCSPSRACIATGQFNSINGVEKLGQSINPKSPRLGKLLQAAGYATGVTGKWHLGKLLKQRDLGFDYFATYNSNGSYYRKFVDLSDPNAPPKPADQHIDAYAVQRACDFIDQSMKAEKPFFLWYNSQTPHLNGNLIWDARPENLARYQAADFYDLASGRNKLPKNWNDDLVGKPDYYREIRNRKKAQTDNRYMYGNPEKLAQHTSEYYAVVTELDQMLKPLLDKLSNTNDPRHPDKKLIDTTYVFFMSDNGWLMGDHGMTSKSLPFDQASRVPLIAMGPGIQAGQQDHHQVANIDMAPTFLQIAGETPPPSMHGRSLLPILTTGAQSGFRTINIVEIRKKTFAGNKPILAGYGGRFEVFYSYETENSTNPCFVEVYDLQHDPWELKNLALQAEITNSSLKAWQKIDAAIQDHREKVLKITRHEMPVAPVSSER